MAECKPQIASIEELESIQVDPQDLAKMLKVGKGLLTNLKEKLKDFLNRNLDIFALSHEDMMDIDPKASCHHLKMILRLPRIGKKEKP